MGFQRTQIVDFKKRGGVGASNAQALVLGVQTDATATTRLPHHQKTTAVTATTTNVQTTMITITCNDLLSLQMMF